MPWLSGRLAGMSAAVVRVDAGPASTGARALLKMFAMLGASAPDPAPVEREKEGPCCWRTARRTPPATERGPAHIRMGPAPKQKSGRARLSGAERDEGVLVMQARGAMRGISRSGGLPVYFTVA